MKDNAQPARWYMIDKDGMATLCTDREDAEKEAKDANMAWPHTAPHRAVQLVEVADVEALRTGYAAARLEIESLQARIKTMTEEHADELMVAHLDGRMRAAQPAPMPDWLPFSKRMQIADRHGVKVTAEFNALVSDVIQTYLETHADRAARAPADSVLEDAARYRWLRQEHERVDPVCHLTWKRNLQRDSSEWVNTAVLDTAIDAARKQGANHD